jgi:hypothetical protein
MNSDNWQWLDTVMLTDEERASIVRLRASHDRLLAAARKAADTLEANGFPYAAKQLGAAIAAAEEPEP